jgi:tetratricopeptide (TPR) repeat protein
VDWTLHLRSRLRRSRLLAERKRQIARLTTEQPYEAEAQYHRVVELSRRHLGDGHPVTLDAVLALGTLQRFLGRYAEAAATLDMAVKHYDPARHRDELLIARAARATVHSHLGEGAEAVRDLRGVVDEATLAWGAEGALTLHTRACLATVLAENGQADEAVEHMADVVAIRTRLVGPDDPTTLCSRHAFGVILVKAKEIDRAEAEFTAAANDTEAGLSCTLVCEHGFADIAAARGLREQAIRGYESVIRGWTDYLGPDTPRADDARNNLAELTG